jgi:hypothetical protein
MKQKALLSIAIFFLSICLAHSQDSQAKQRLHFSSSFGVNKIQGPLNRTFRHSLAVHSGLEKRIGKRLIAAIDVGFNTIQYDQQKIDQHSGYLFKNTRSSFIVAGLNGGIRLGCNSSRFQFTPYLGAGYLNTGEPRLQVDTDQQTVRQRIIRHSGFFGRAGTRCSYWTGSSVLQFLFIDCSYWSSTVQIGGHRIRSVSVFTGMRMKM